MNFCIWKDLDWTRLNLGKGTMLRSLNNVVVDYRENPRIPFHCPVAVVGVDSNARVTELSLGGFYIETKSSTKIGTNQKVNLVVKLPEQRAGVTIKAKVVHQDLDGFGCQFCDLDPQVQRMLTSYFDMFSGMLPID